MIVNIQDRKYNSYFYDPPIEINHIHPFLHKLFHGDEIIYNERDNKVQIQCSPTRSAKYLAGVLNLESKMTYGRTPNQKRLYYSCTPFQKELPIFLVPYEISLSFQKTPRNKFVLFRFDHWTEVEKHPYGILYETIGDVDDLPSYYEYQLFARYLRKKNPKIKFDLSNLDTYTDMILKNPDRFGSIEDRRYKNTKIFSIDPQGCTDRDDALSIQPTEDPHIFEVSVYIANVWIWIEMFQLWDFLRETVSSTIYLPDKNRHMLPCSFTENVCSLNSGKSSFAFVMDFQINIIEKTIIPIKTTQTCIYVSNYDYESKVLLWKNKEYQLLLEKTREIDTYATDSHSLVAFWMMKMNIHMAKELHNKKTGIFRITKTNPNTNQNSIVDTKTTSSIPFLRIWEQRISGEYVGFKNSVDYHHSILDVPLYTHFTSPIRRMVDLINQIIFVGKYTFILTQECIDKINRESKYIRKIQNECELLHKFQSINNTDILDGIIFHVEKKEEKYKYTVYLSLYNTIICTNDSSIYKKEENVKCSIYLFQREDNTKQKIKLKIQ